MPEIQPEALTPADLVGLGLDAVNDRLPTAVLVAAARKYVQAETAKRRRTEARRAEQRAHGENPAIRSRVRAITIEAALEHEVVWAEILDVPIGEGGEGQTWGSATIDDHDFAAEQAETTASGHVQRAAMHRRAIVDLTVRGARTLAGSTMGLE
jgi:hypothetical protein